MALTVPDGGAISENCYTGNLIRLVTPNITKIMEIAVASAELYKYFEHDRRTSFC